MTFKKPNSCFAALIATNILLWIASSSIAQEKQKYFQNIGTKPSVALNAAKLDNASKKLRLHIPNEKLKSTGNAASNYYRAAIFYSNLPAATKQRELVWKAIRQPLTDLNPQDFSTILAKTQFCFDEIKTGAHCQKCTWETSGFEGGPLKVVQKLIPELDPFRAIQDLLMLKARISIKEKRFDDAIRWLAIANQFAMHVGKMEFIVCGISAKRMIDKNLDLVEEMSGIPGAPNFHAALSALPKPTIDLRQLIRRELNYWRKAFPVLEKPIEQKRTADQWRNELLAFYQTGRIVAGYPKPEPPEVLEKKFGWMAAQQYDTAFRSLVNSGMKPADLEKMPVGQVIAIHASQLLNQYCGQSLEQLELPAHRFKSPRFGRPGPMPLIGISHYVEPTVGAVRSEFVLARRIAAMKNGQAIRHYMAQHDNRLPSRADDLDPQLIAIDPMANQPFEFTKIKNGVALRRIHSKPKYDLIEQIIFTIPNSAK